MNLPELVKQIVEYEHMGKVDESQPIFTDFQRGILRLNWTAQFEGKSVRQYAEFKFTSICLDNS